MRITVAGQVPVRTKRQKDAGTHAAFDEVIKFTIPSYGPGMVHMLYIMYIHTEYIHCIFYICFHTLYTLNTLYTFVCARCETVASPRQIETRARQRLVARGSI